MQLPVGLTLTLVSIQLIAPASGASLLLENRLSSSSRVSIQLIAPASGAEKTLTEVNVTSLVEVSIQLIAPASGANGLQTVVNLLLIGFHSTDCPSEWGLYPGNNRQLPSKGFHSTDCPSEWGLSQPIQQGDA